MLEELSAQMVRAHITKRELADKLGISYGTLLAKFKGESELSYPMACQIRSIVAPHKSIDELFADSLRA